MYCPKCGKPLPDDDPDTNFCPKCGKGLHGQTAAEQPRPHRALPWYQLCYQHMATDGLSTSDCHDIAPTHA